MPPLCLLVSACLLGEPEPAFRPTSDFTEQEVEGYRALVLNRLLAEDRALGEETLAVLRTKLFDMNHVLPAEAREALQKVPVWIETDDPHGRHPCMCYHPSREWLTENGYNPEKAGSVEIANAATFLKWIKDQPFMVLHEFAHAYHHQVLGYDNPEVRQAYQQARAGGQYGSVLRFSGQMERAYALNNDQEYFAELTECYFGTNDFYPFVRAELQQHDPEGLAMVRKLWGDEKGDPAQ